ncbi:hypothetical protein AAG906_020073 [Vitis piasezkii]
MDGSIGNVPIMSESDRRYLFEKAMEGDWEAVVIGNQKDVLDIKKEQGDTPLHLAVAIGNVSMCLHIACGHPYLVGVCNKELEPPLFVAARHGKIGAFFCLLDMSGSRAQFYGKLRNKNGETILHCAIAGGHSKLAYLMAQQYEDLVNTISDRGASPVDKLISHYVPDLYKSIYQSYINFLPMVCCSSCQKLDDELLLETKMKTEGMGVLETPILITAKKWNSALHLAAMFADYRPWVTPGVALQMQWEVKWYEV